MLPQVFGFKCECRTCRGHEFVHNGGWYNKDGEKLGWGDLEPADFLRISNGLEDGELFIVIRESDSFGDFVTRPSTLIGSMSDVDPAVEAPGVDFVAEKCRYIIARHQLYKVDRRGSKEETLTEDGLQFTVLTPDAAKQLIFS